MKTATMALAALALAATANAQEPAKQQDRQINPFSDCGIGAALFPNADTAWAAVISNVTWDVGTTAVISAVSSPNTCNGGRVRTAMYITSTYASLEAETAAGQGKYLTALADTMSCDTSVHPALFTRVRAEMAGVMSVPGFAEQDKLKKAEAYFNVVDRVARDEFSAACSMT